MQHAIKMTRFFPLRITIAAAAALMIFVGPVFAETVQTVWSCGYDRETSFLCRLKDGTTADTITRDILDSADHGGTSREFARAGKLPGIVRTLRDRPGALVGQLIKVPLHSEPVDMAFAHQLVVAVMCGSGASCHVEFQPEATELAQLPASDLVDATDLALEE